MICVVNDKKRLVVVFSLMIVSCIKVFAAPPKEKITLIISSEVKANSRANFGVGRLMEALQKAGYQTAVASAVNLASNRIISIQFKRGRGMNDEVDGFPNDSIFYNKERFFIKGNTKQIAIQGNEASGILYGCMALADSVYATGKLPQNITLSDAPEMVLRGQCIGLQKPAYLPGRGVYEYPYTPETFPWFYDKKLWLQTLDSMASNRMNTLYLWNGHPFSSLVKVQGYEIAVEVNDSTFKANEDIFRFLTTEADKRGIWVIQAFYNIILPKPFAEKYGLKTQDRNRPTTPLIADYTQKSIAAFVAKYPNVGLLVTLGEAMEGTGQQDIDWFTKTIIPGVKDGLKVLGQKEQPPIILRAHDTDAPTVIKHAKPLYDNLYTMAKYNGEALTTYEPRGSWAELHRNLSSNGTVQIENVHILANLEPFQYGATHFIQKCVQSMHNIYHANGLHLYPESSYWDWPYSADKACPRLLQIERDWVWYKAWARYAWNSKRDSTQEDKYWATQLATHYGSPTYIGDSILKAYNESGEIAPKLLRRYGITDGNRQTLTLGMLMTQLINPFRYGLFNLLYTSESPEGEMIVDFAEKEAKGEKHIGETPMQIAKEVIEHGEKAVAAIDKALPFIAKNKAAFLHVQNDIRSYQELAQFYSWKAKAAMQVLKYKYSHNLSDLQMALPLLQKSVDHFTKLAALTKDAYLYANSMQTQQRKIPVPGTNATMKTWVELLPVYQKELDNFTRHLDSLKTVPPGSLPKEILPLTIANVQSLKGADSSYTVKNGTSVFGDSMVNIAAVAPELVGMQGLYFNKLKQQAEGTHLQFSCTQPVTLLIGFLKDKDKDPKYIPEPQLEIDASANDYGQAEIKIANAVVMSGMPLVNVHAYTFAAGSNTLDLGKGIALVLGFTDGKQPLKPRDAGLTAERRGELDWLFE